MYAVIENGGKQYRVASGDVVELETMAGDVGAEVDLGRVLAIVEGDSVKTGADAGGVKVTGDDPGERPQPQSHRLQVQAARNSTSAPSDTARTSRA